MIYELDRLRATVSRGLVAWIWLNAALAGLCGMAAGNGWAGPLLIGVVIAAVTHAVWFMAPAAAATRLSIAVGFIAIISVILASCRGSPLQIDVHMYYFAALAVLAAYCDRMVILAGAGVIALHHLTLNFLAPALVFPDGGNFPRVALHAVIVVAEAGALFWLTGQIVRLFTLSGANLAAAKAASDRAAHAAQEAAVQRQGIEAERRQAEEVRALAASRLEQVVATLAEALAGLAAGRLNHRLEAPFPPEYEVLRRDFNAATAQLRETIEALLGNANSVHGGAEQISHAADDLAARTERQAAALGETAGRLDEITTALNKTAVSAAHARAVVAAARTSTDASGTVVNEAVEAMSGIDHSSRQISQIIGVINDIAFQTNLLALNAGVEAARAGDAGRGFAVVATEVRALAQRTSDAAREIRALIGASEVQVQAGVDRVAKTGEVLRHLAGQVSEIDRAIIEISDTAQSQTASLSQVNETLARMDQATQQNAAMVEQTSAASRSLLAEARQMAAKAGRFAVTPEAARQPAMAQLKALATL
ncbi:methyl-accepting chemotaxis protein [Acidocella sp.]|uniref:methyl-accepting chemotaxis protein n=1 Tax=Acidocella sp. TaxID=50710 RepID=UPI00260B1F4F|nr:methyl-accepting chemotaxis protein [Acidocella sp.]